MDNTVTFVASRRKALLVLLLSICLVALGVWLIPEWPFLGWISVAFFGLGIPVSLLMVWSPNSTYLRLDEEGFEMGSIVRKQKYKWADVDGFHIGSIYGARMIAIAFNPEYRQQRVARSVAAILSGLEAAIANQYNATLEQILEALTTWKQRHGRDRA